MQTNLLWTEREYYSLENCLVTTSNSGSEINSIIVGKYEEKIYRVEYTIKTNHNWETIHAEIRSQHSDRRQHLILEGDGKGNWMSNNIHADQFKNCIDIDIRLTLFTNSLPINRLKLAQGEEREIQVIYLDLLEGHIVPVRQKYIHVSDTKYHYENISNDFAAEIEFDSQGFVVDYPSLFVRTAALHTDYH